MGEVLGALACVPNSDGGRTLGNIKMIGLLHRNRGTDLYSLPQRQALDACLMLAHDAVSGTETERPRRMDESCTGAAFRGRYLAEVGKANTRSPIMLSWISRAFSLPCVGNVPAPISNYIVRAERRRRCDWQIFAGI
jgi:hypothetical protein